VVDAGDYQVWMSYFGETVGGAGTEVAARSEERGASGEELRISDLGLRIKQSAIGGNGDATPLSINAARPVLGGLGVPLLVNGPMRDEALLVWLAGWEEMSARSRELSTASLRLGASSYEEWRKTGDSARDDFADSTTGAVDEVFAGAVLAAGT
jgi:hypothetical protein